jgi:hypothetical protein
MAAAKIDGFDVTPETDASAMSSFRLPVSRRSREMSSSQTDTPAADRPARFSFALIGFLQLFQLVISFR